MGIVVGIGRSDSREHVLVALAREEIPVGESGLAERRQAGIPGGIGNNARAAANLNNIKHLQPPFSCCPQMWIKHLVEDT